MVPGVSPHLARQKPFQDDLKREPGDVDGGGFVGPELPGRRQLDLHDLAPLQRPSQAPTLVVQLQSSAAAAIPQQAASQCRARSLWDVTTEFLPAAEEQPVHHSWKPDHDSQSAHRPPKFVVETHETQDTTEAKLRSTLAFPRGD